MTLNACGQLLSAGAEIEVIYAHFRMMRFFEVNRTSKHIDNQNTVHDILDVILDLKHIIYMFINVTGIIMILHELGYDFKLQKLVKIQMYNYAELAAFLENGDTVRSLKNITANKIRKKLYPNVWFGAKRLNLPSSLQCYLTLEEFNNSVQDSEKNDSYNDDVRSKDNDDYYYHDHNDYYDSDS